MLHIGIQVWRQYYKYGWTGFWDPEYTFIEPLDGAYEAPMPHAEAMHIVHGMLNYETFRYTQLSVRQMMTEEEAKARVHVPHRQKKLKVGHAVIIDDSLIAGQPEHCVPSAFEEHDDA
eukprot:107608-Pleurochrysis_carterae.AAC.1